MAISGEARTMSSNDAATDGLIEALALPGQIARERFPITIIAMPSGAEPPANAIQTGAVNLAAGPAPRQRSVVVSQPLSLA